MARKKTTSAPVESLRHKDKRKNIPTEELRDFVADDEHQPEKILYPRDPSLDPQLVWKGKDQQDSHPLEVPAVPIYIQDKIHPQAIIEDFRRNLPSPSGRGAGGEGAGGEGAEPEEVQLGLFDDFNGLPEEFDKRVDFYHHEGNWSNRLILGDSLLVMTSLAEKEGLKGKVQMIYLDPPYGIKFGSNWQVSTRKRDVKDGKAEDATRQPEQVQAFRDTWQLGIHSYLAYLRDRLVVARELLTESGSIFVQIGDENVHLVRCVLDEVLGPDNCIALITVRKTTSASGDLLSGVSDYVLWYARASESVKYRQLYYTKEVGGQGGGQYTWVEEEDGFRRRATPEEVISARQGLRYFRPDQLTSQRPSQGADLRAYALDGRVYTPGRGTFKSDQKGLDLLQQARRLMPVGNTLTYIRYIEDFPAFPMTNLWHDTVVSGFAEKKIYVVQTSPTIAERCLLMTTDPGDLVLDPTCGSATTAYVAEQWGRRWITIDTSRVALTLARTRLMAARFPYYLLADSPEGRRKEFDLQGVPAWEAAKPERPLPGPLPEGEGDVRKGFIYKRVPHVTLKSIANNEGIDTIHAKWQEQLEPLRAKINKALGKKWEEWEVPRPDALTPGASPASGRGEKRALTPGPSPKGRGEKELLEPWWELRRARQKEIDASIARRADVELLYDQPYEDPKRVRVTGPFTVESLSPHRTISVERKKNLTIELEGTRHPRVIGPDDFGHMILEHLRVAGVQNTYKKERLKLDTLDPFPGEWIHGAGTYTESGGKTRRVAVCIGPEHGTVGPQLVKEAAKEAVQGVGFDVLVLCGFAFDPHVSEEAKRYGKLVVLPTRMNPDLSMGELLKKTGSGNLFMVFGEPDVEIQRIHPQMTQKDTDKKKDKKKQSENLCESVESVDRIVVEIKGVDVYDPTTGEIRSSSTDDVACWFIDTNYNEESFFVRHAYFTGADQPYEKLKRALRAEIDEAAWSALYSTVSRPFDPPETGKIAVKVINHFGDEVLKVYDVEQA